jgi:type II secretion system protein G
MKISICRVSASQQRQAFTLIELLIVIAIILILIAIALPNFLEAQMRAKVTKCKGEIRSLGMALDQYYLDFKYYPSESEHNIFGRSRFEAGLLWLTTPIKYMSSIPFDPFGEQGNGGELTAYEMGGIEKGVQVGMASKCARCLVTWALFTRGPDYQESDVYSAQPHAAMYDNDRSVDSYSPTNGTKSLGDIFQFGGDPFWIGVNMSTANLSLYQASGGRSDFPLVVDRDRYLHRMPPKLR